MLNITARDASSFTAIEAALAEFDEQEVFLQYFETAVQSETDVEGITIILRNTRKFKKDLNKRKYIINIPTTMSIDAFEFVKKFESRCGSKRVPFYTVLIKGHLTESEVKFILILTGFNDDAIRVVSNDVDPATVEGSVGGENTTGCSAKCPMMNNALIHRLHCPPPPVPHVCVPVGLRPPFPPIINHEDDHICPMPFMNCSEESFIIDTII